MDSLVDLRIFVALSITPGLGSHSVKAAEEKQQQESGRRTLIVHVAQHSTAQHSTAQHSTTHICTAEARGDD